MTTIFVVLLVAPLWLISMNSITAKIGQKMNSRPLIEVDKFTYSEVTTLGTSKVVLGSLGYHFADHEHISDMDFVQESKGSLQTLSSKKAEKYGDIIRLNGDIVCNNGQGYTLKTQQANYNSHIKRLDISSSFVLTSSKYQAIGSSAIVLNDGKQIVAKDIKAKIQMDNKK